MIIIDSESAKRDGKIQLDDEVTGTNTTGSIKTAGIKAIKFLFLLGIGTGVDKIATG